MGINFVLFQYVCNKNIRKLLIRFAKLLGMDKFTWNVVQVNPKCKGIAQYSENATDKKKNLQKFIDLYILCKIASGCFKNVLLCNTCYCSIGVVHVNIYPHSFLSLVIQRLNVDFLLCHSVHLCFPWSNVVFVIFFVLATRNSGFNWYMYFKTILYRY